MVYAERRPRISLTTSRPPSTHQVPVLVHTSSNQNNIFTSALIPSYLHGCNPPRKPANPSKNPTPIINTYNNIKLLQYKRAVWHIVYCVLVGVSFQIKSSERCLHFCCWGFVLLFVLLFVCIIIILGNAGRAVEYAYILSTA